MRVFTTFFLFAVLAGCNDKESTITYELNEHMIDAKMKRCLEVGICRMDCAVLVYGHGARPDAHSNDSTTECHLTDEDGRLKEIFTFESEELWCQDDTGTACSGVNNVVELHQ